MIASLYKRGDVYYAKFKMDSWPAEKRESLGTSDERVARAKFEQRQQEHEREAAGLITPRRFRDAAKEPLDELCERFLTELTARDKADGTIKKYRIALQTVRREAGWKVLGQVTERSMQEWMLESKMRPKSRNDYLAVWSRMFRWMRRQRLVPENICEFVERMDTHKSAREYRRALTEEEAIRLLMTAPHPRRVFYRLVLETGLRRLEMLRLRVGDFFLGDEKPKMGVATPMTTFAIDAAGPCVRAPGSITKNHKPALLSLSAELALELRKLIPADAPASDRAFVKLVPKNPAFRRDLARAGIKPVDDLGRRADLHALRKTFGTHLVLSGAEPRVVMEAMRQSDLKLTMKTYMDAAQLRGPVLEAVKGLPWRSMGAEAATPVEGKGMRQGM
jgi:integrase